MNRYIGSAKVAVPAVLSPRLLDQLGERLRYLHYSLSTEKVELRWAGVFMHWRASVRWHLRNTGELSQGS